MIDMKKYLYTTKSHDITKNPQYQMQFKNPQYSKDAKSEPRYGEGPLYLNDRKIHSLTGSSASR